MIVAHKDGNILLVNRNKDTLSGEDLANLNAYHNNVEYDVIVKNGVLSENEYVTIVEKNGTYDLVVSSSRQPVAPKMLEEKISDLESEKADLLQATIDLADTVATQNAQLQEQSDALLDLANMLSEVNNNG